MSWFCLHKWLIKDTAPGTIDYASGYHADGTKKSDKETDKQFRGMFCISAVVAAVVSVTAVVMLAPHEPLGLFAILLVTAGAGGGYLGGFVLMLSLVIGFIALDTTFNFTKKTRSV